MISRTEGTETLDLSHQPLGPGWLRRPPLLDPAPELAGPGLWQTGPRLLFRDALVTALRQAREVVLLSSFLLAEPALADAMVTAALRGVRVYALCASDHRLGLLPRQDDAFEAKMVEQHKALLEQLAGQVCLRSGEHIHAKFLVIDPQGPAPLAFLSTANFNRALSESVELGVRLEGETARALAACFRWAFWCEATHELRPGRRLVEVKPRQPAAPPRPAHPSLFATLQEGTALREEVLRLIAGARTELVVASYGLEAAHPAVRALCDAARRGVRVGVLTRPRPAVAEAAAALEAAGATVLGHDKLHAKAVWSDGQVLVMSANLEAQGLDRGFETGVRLPAPTSAQVEAVLRAWERTFPWCYASDATRGTHTGPFCPAEASLRTGVVRVTECFEQRLPTVIAQDVRRLEEARPVRLEPAPPPDEWPRCVQFRWPIEPPKLPGGARERKQPLSFSIRDERGAPGEDHQELSYEPPVYEHQGKLYVRMRTPAEADAAAALATELGAVVVT
jgi:cardiolipin synthase